MNFEPFDRALRQAVPTNGPLDESVDPAVVLLSVAGSVAQNEDDSRALDLDSFHRFASEYLNGQRLLRVDWNGMDLFYDMFACGRRWYVWSGEDGSNWIAGAVDSPHSKSAIAGIIVADWPLGSAENEPIRVIQLSELVDASVLGLAHRG